MAEWATLKLSQGLRGRNSLEKVFVPFVLAGLLARGGVLGLHPFGIAFGAALILKGERGYVFGLLGVLAGVLSLGDLIASLKVLLILGILSFLFPYVRKKKHEGLYLAGITGMITSVTSLALAYPKTDFQSLLSVGLYGVLAGGIAVVFWFALSHQEALWRGEFTGEQGVAWLLLLIGVLSGLQGVQIAEFNVSIIVLSFFILFVADRFGAGTAAGVGALLGFLTQLTLDVQNLMNAGIYGIAGFTTGAFQRLGKIGIGLAFSAVTLMLTFFLRQEAIYSQLVSSALGLLLFLIWPGSSSKENYLKPKPMPEVEATVSKVKALADMFDQIAMSYHAAEAETSDGKPEIPELMNVLVERVCNSCPTIGVCWEREFYKTYRYMFDLFAMVENRGDIKLQELPIEWKRHCGRLKEMLLGVQFIMEQEQNREAWRRKISLNQENMSRQFKSVSQVIGNFAKELHTRNNWEKDKQSTLARRRRNYLDIGVSTYSKSGNRVSGDNYASLAFSPTQHAFVLSDGMGTGEEAAKMSATALTFLEQLLSTGFEPDGALQALNSILVLKSPEETFVTVDMAVLDLESNGLKLIKAGASPSYLKNSEGVEVLEASSLPIGILDQVEIPVIDTYLETGGILIMVTDGINDLLKDGSDWIRGFLEKTELGHPSQELADIMVKEARGLSGGNFYDDGVALVIQKKFWND